MLGAGALTWGLLLAEPSWCVLHKEPWGMVERALELVFAKQKWPKSVGKEMFLESDTVHKAGGVPLKHICRFGACPRCLNVAHTSTGTLSSLWQRGHYWHSWSAALKPFGDGFALQPGEQMALTLSLCVGEDFSLCLAIQV